MTFDKTALAFLGGAALLATPALAEDSGPVVLANYSIIQEQDNSSAWDSEEGGWENEDGSEARDRDDAKNNAKNSSDNNDDDDHRHYNNNDDNVHNGGWGDEED